MKQTYSIDYETWLENLEGSFFMVLMTVIMMWSVLSLFLK